MKGISPVIAIILLLLITISIIGFTSVFFQQTVQTSGEQAQESLNERSDTLLQTAEIIDATNNKVTIKNVGGAPISIDNVKIFLDGEPVTATPIDGASDIAPGAVKTFDITIPPGTGERKLTISVPGSIREKTLQLDAGTTELISTNENTVTLKNTGVAPIQKSDINMELDTASVSFSGPDTLGIGATETYTIDVGSLSPGTTRQLEINTPASLHSATVEINIGTISIETITGNKLSVKNTGLTQVSKSQLTLTVAGQAATFSGPAQIEPDETVEYAVNEIEILGREGLGGALSLQSPATTINDNAAFDYSSTTKGYWKFDDLDQGTTIKDSSGNNMHGTFVGATYNGIIDMAIGSVTASGKYGKGLSISASGSSPSAMNSGNPSALGFGTGSFSYGLWMKQNGGAGDPIFKGGTSAGTRGFDIEVFSGGTAVADISDGSIILNAGSGTVVTDNSWHHIFVVVDRSGVISATPKLYIFIDGVQKGATNIPAAFGSVTSSSNLNFPRSGDGFLGVIDEARFYGRALTAAEVLTDMNSVYPLQGVAVSYSFESVAGNTAHDTHFIVRGKNDALSDPDGALQLKGGSDYVLINDNAGLRGMGELTMSVLANPSAMASGYNGRIISTSSPGNYDWYLQTSNQKVVFSVSNSASPSVGAGLTTSGAYIINSWNHLLCVYNKNIGSDNMRCYIGGSVDPVTATQVLNVRNAATPVRLGSYSGSGSMMGLFDEIRIMDKAASAD
ncbi:MAG: type IV pilin [Candidatus Aenigmarchaeota archaeon]|nr:type IV pilin [Candidatus Aenigmarchaeota archaeon]